MTATKPTVTSAPHSAPHRLKAARVTVVNSLPAAEVPASLSCLQQAEICREQARDAARLKRFRAAFGLFSTAASLCRHVFAGKEADEPTKELAAERLHQIDIEMATYAELARSFKVGP